MHLPHFAFDQLIEVDFAARKVGLPLTRYGLAAVFAHFPQHLVLSGRWYAGPQFLRIQLSQGVQVHAQFGCALPLYKKSQFCLLLFGQQGRNQVALVGGLCGSLRHQLHFLQHDGEFFK